jgi:single-strand DNA-binding protein
MINKVILEGRMVKDPQLNKTNSGMSVARFSLAVDNEDKNKTTSFIDCLVWNASAETLCKYTHKGSTISVVGRLNQRNYTRKDGTNASVVEVQVDTFYFLDKKSSSTTTNNSATTKAPIKNEQNIDINDDLPF